MRPTLWRSVVMTMAALAALWAGGPAWAADPLAGLEPTPRLFETARTIVKMTDPKGPTSVKLAPDGQHIAVMTWTGEASALLMVDTQTWATSYFVTPRRLPGWDGILQPLKAHWISNDALAVDFNDERCVVMPLDGGRGRVLGRHFVRMLPADRQGEPPQWAIVEAEGVFGGSNLRRINVFTGDKVNVPVDLPGDLVRTVFDRRGRLRAATTQETKWFTPGAKVSNWYRRDEKSEWQLLAQAAVTDELWTPLGLPDDSDTLIVLSREGRDTWAMFDYDVATRRIGQLRVGHATEDLVDAEEDKDQVLIRATTHGLRPKIHWFDARWDHLQRSIDAVLPDSVNMLSGDPKGKVLVFSYSDRDPGVWMLLDTSNMTLREVVRRLPAVERERMRPVRTLTYAAADGMTIPAFLTLPSDAPNTRHPMVVYIHGGPVARDEWQWDREVQSLAAAGYAVFQPQFRGSSGFGRKFELAGYRQWGLAMQDDVTAGVKAMIDQGFADPSRICIYGASYGGYAALWGLVKTPELYRCGISLAGVTDIGERFSDWSDTNASKAGRQWLRFAVGDIDTMAAQFDAVSPVKHAAKIQAPVLLAHGTDDERVPIGHSRRMAAALTSASHPVETRWYEGEGHGLSKVVNIRAFNLTLIQFLDRHIGPAVTTAPAPAAAD